MAKHYYFNNNIDKNGNHEVHERDCGQGADRDNRTYIGFKNDCHEAIRSAKRDHPLKPFDGCRYCSPNCSSD